LIPQKFINPHGFIGIAAGAVDCACNRLDPPFVCNERALDFARRDSPELGADWSREIDFEIVSPFGENLTSDLPQQR
jgi:hypothetical protein